MKKVFEHIIVWSLLISSVFTLVFIQFTDNQVDYSFYLGLFGILLTFMVSMKSKKVSKYLLGFILVIGTLNLIQFSHVEIEFELSLNNIGLKDFNPIVLLFLLLFVIINFKSLLSIFSKRSSLTEQDIVEMEAKQIEHFKT